MRPLAAAAFLTGALVLLAGCGGGERNDEPAHPTIPGDVAESLASQPEAIATTLDAGHECETARQADALREASAQIPGKPAGSDLRESVRLGAWPVRETRGRGA